MKKLDSVKKPRSLISALTTLIVIVSLLVFVFIAVLVVVAYNINGKTDVSNDLVIPILRSFILIFPIEGVLVFILISLLLVFRLLKKKNVVMKNVNAFYDFARSDVICIDECDVFMDNKCVVKEVVKLSKENENEIIDIVGSIASSISNDDPVLKAIQELSFIPLFSSLEVNQSNGAYLASHKDKRYILGKVGTFKYRAEEYVKTKVEPYLLKGYGITLVGKFEKDIKTDKYVEFADVFGIIVTKNEINHKYRNMIEALQKEGVEFKLLSSENPIAASEHAKALGIKNGEKFYLMQKNTSVDGLLVNNHVVFGYSTMGQKEQIIATLQKEGHVVSSFMSRNGAKNPNCTLSYVANNSDILIEDTSLSINELREESISYSNKANKLFILMFFKMIFVDLYMIAISVCSLTGLGFNYKPLGLGVLLMIISLISLYFVDEHQRRAGVKRRLLLGSILSACELAALFIMFAIQYNGVAYTGINGLDVCLTMCGIVFVANQLVVFTDLLIPFAKKRYIVLAINGSIAVVVNVLLYVLSINLRKELFGLAFNKLNGQCWVTMLLIFILFTSLYFVITYLIDNYKKGGDE